MKTGFIYRIWNIKTGKSYIGQSINNPTRRINVHLRGEGNRLIKEAVIKDKRESFKYEILEEFVPQSLLDYFEINYIKRFDTLVPKGYNLTNGGAKTFQKGNKITKEHKKKISKALKGRTFSKKHRENLSKAAKRKKRTEEQKRKISNTLKKYTKTKKHRENLSKAAIKAHKKRKQKKKKKTKQQMLISDFSHTLNIKPISINVCFQGRRFKTDVYKKYEKDILSLLQTVKLDIPAKGDLLFKLEIGCSRNFDLDNAVKPFVDILQKKYLFNDNRITEMHLKKTIIKKGEEYIKFNLIPIS